MVSMVFGAGQTIRQTMPALSAYPSLRHFFPCSDGAGTYGLRDVVGNVVYAKCGWTAPDSKSIKTTYVNEAVGHNLLLSAGAWNIDRTKKTLALVCVKNTTSAYYSIGIGDSAPLGEEIVFSSSFYLITLNSASQGATTIASPSGVSIGNTLATMVGGYFTPGISLVGFSTNTSGIYTPQTSVSLATQPLAPAYSGYGSLSGPAMEALYGIAVFQFNTAFPLDIKHAIEWMRREWESGNKQIYPGWVGVS